MITYTHPSPESLTIRDGQFIHTSPKGEAILTALESMDAMVHIIADRWPMDGGDLDLGAGGAGLREFWAVCREGLKNNSSVIA